MNDGRPAGRTEANKAVLRALVTDMDRGHLERIEQYYHPAYEEHGGSGKSESGVAGVRAGLTAFAAAFDEARHEIEDLVAEGDRVAARISFSGIFARPLFGLPPTGRRVTAAGVAIYRMEDGRIREKWGYFNTLEHLRAVRG